MYKRIRTLILLFVCQALSMPLWAQVDTSGRPVEMADKFRADGKIYVVIAVVVTILLGLIVYVARLDKKISKFEKDNCPSGEPLAAAKELK